MDINYIINTAIVAVIGIIPKIIEIIIKHRKEYKNKYSKHKKEINRPSDQT